jgi:hypothetical protein
VIALLSVGQQTYTNCNLKGYDRIIHDGNFGAENAGLGLRPGENFSMLFT